MKHHQPLSDIRRWQAIFIAATVAAVPAFIAIIVLLLQYPAARLHAPAPTGAVSITPDGFQPATLSVKAGTIVTWTNTDGHQPHWVEADPFPTPTNPADLTSNQLVSNTRFSYVFPKPGTYHYHDRLNPTHGGTIVVE